MQKLLTMYDSQFILGAILFTFIISRVFFLLLLWLAQPYRLLLANLATLITVTLLRAHGMAVDAPPDYTEALMAYILPVAFWTGFDFYRYHKHKTKGQAEMPAED